MAISATPIWKCTEQELSQLLSYIIVLIGLRAENMPDELSKGILKEFIRKKYPNNTTEEVKLAFEMAITARFDVDPCCYEDFSCIYFAKIMEAYRGWAKLEHKFVHQPTPKMMIEHKEDLSDVAMTDWLASLMKDVAAKPDYPVEFMPVTLYDWLDKNGYVQKTTPQKREYMDKAIILRAKVLVANARENPNAQNVKRRDHFLSLQANGRFWGEDLEDVKSLAKRILLLDMIKNEEIAI